MVCLDTTFIIDLLRGNENIKEIKVKLDDKGSILYVPAPVVVELISGVNLKTKRQKEEEIIKNFLSTITVLSLDKESAILAGEIEAELINNGETIDIEDILIAAISIKNNEELVTRNIKHFNRIKDLSLMKY